MCDSNPKSDIYKYWSRDIQCNTNYGECDFINHACICHDGYTHDLSYIRQRACLAPEIYFPIVYGIQLGSSVIVLPFVLAKLKQSTSIARLSMKCAISASVLHIIYCAILISSRFVISPINMFLLYFYIFFLSATKCMEIFSFVSPLTAAAMKSITPAKYTLFTFFGFYRVAELVPIVIATAKYSDAKNHDNDLPWSVCVMTFSLIVGVEALTLALFIIIYAVKMLRFIDDLTSSMKKSSGDNSSKIPAEYLTKVKKLIIRTSVILPPLGLVLFFAPVVIISTNFLPGSYVFSSIPLATVPPMVFTSTVYASKLKQASDRSQGAPSSFTSNKGKDLVVPFNQNNNTNNQQTRITNSEQQSSLQN